MKIYAVTCNEDRMIRLRTAAEPLNLEIIAIKSPFHTDEEVQRRGKTCFERGTSYPTGMAATLGHIRAMQAFVDSGDDFAIIIEDDVRFHKKFNEYLKILIHHMETHPVDIFSLGFCSYPVSQGLTEFLEDIEIMENTHISNPWGAQCYIIKRSYAEYFTNLFSVDDVSIPYQNHFVTDWVMFDPILGCKRSTLMIPIVLESPDEQTIAGSYNKPDMFQIVNKDDFYL